MFFLFFQTNYQSKRSVIINLSRSPTTRSDPSELSNESVSSTVHDRISGNLSSSSNLNSTDHSYAIKGDEPNILQVNNFKDQVLNHETIPPMWYFFVNKQTNKCFSKFSSSLANSSQDVWWRRNPETCRNVVFLRKYSIILYFFDKKVGIRKN